VAVDLAVKYFHQNQGNWSGRFSRMGEESLSVSVNPLMSQCIHDYLRVADHGSDIEGVLLCLSLNDWGSGDDRSRTSADSIDYVPRKYRPRLAYSSN
jgi:hypothetical protein